MYWAPQYKTTVVFKSLFNSLKSLSQKQRVQYAYNKRIPYAHTYFAHIFYYKAIREILKKSWSKTCVWCMRLFELNGARNKTMPV